MTLESIITFLQSSNLTNEIEKRINRNDRLLFRGASRSARALLATSLAKRNKRPLLVIVPTMEESTRWLSLLQEMSWERVFIYPTSEISPYEKAELTTEIVWGQLQVLSELLSLRNKSNLAIITTDRALQPHLPTTKIFEKNCIHIQKGELLDIDKLSHKLSKLGYERQNAVEQESTWARRGDIIDIYPVSNELPIRIELFGDLIDKIREFDPITQKSLDEINSLTITPSTFNNLIIESIKSKEKSEIEGMISHEIYEKLNEDGLIKDELQNEIRPLMGIAWDKPVSIIQYLPKDTCIVVDEPSQVIAHANIWFTHIDQNYKELNNCNIFSKDIKPNLHKEIKQCMDEVNNFWGFDMAELDVEDKNNSSISIACKSIPILANQFGKLAELIKDYQKNKFNIFILSAQPSRSTALLEEHDCFGKFVTNSKDWQSISSLLNSYTPVALKSYPNPDIEGIELPAWKIVIISDKEFFGQQSLNTPGYVRRRKTSASRKINPNKMSPGDYVVHRNHGIGRFLRIERIALTGDYRDYLVIEYEDGKLSVAADQLGSLGRYRNTGVTKPKINRLGGNTWNKNKEKARKAIRKIAIDLVKLYAERQNNKGISFPKDGPWQRELEDSFPYDPTPDQITAIKEVKRDMEKDQTMDRLICGDVGFGKTEVAIRAMFKAITAGKQVALLAPTTILSQQHWRTISERFAPYPIKVALLNRFKTNKEKTNIFHDLSNGKIDAVIGTHQLLNKRISFKKLGLLVVDEEQRFGVNQKEKIKELKINLDVLTLSATPIPRTLYMSLSGVREMSLITTPPPMRRSIKTHLCQLDNEVIRSAISQELDRGGQIFYVVPRIKDIEKVAENLRNMLPKLKIIIAHGQMDEGELENSMIAFNGGEAELMLCTTIIESGLDIPRVNTILIEDSHIFGLSQLYQLRGRVGRSGIQAHAWLFYPSEEKITQSSRKRLQAIQEFAELGSGYQLAMRDMEIRGVGNILGMEQSGQMEAIGFDLYMEILQESLAEIQGKDLPTVDETQVDLSVTAFIPADWITNNDEKISAYRSATECNSDRELIDLAATWNDMYGKIPYAVESLLMILRLKIRAKSLAISRIYKVKNNIILETPMDESTFLLLRKGLPKHLHGRLIYNNKVGKTSEIVVRGIGVLDVDKQINQLMEWFQLMYSEFEGLL